MTKLGIIGTGNIATTILNYVKNFPVNKIYVYDINPAVQTKFVNKFKSLPLFSCRSVKEVVSFADVVIESASVDAVKEIFSFIRKNKKKKFIFLSVGGVLEHYKLYTELVKQGYKIFIPSGAIAGCDAISSLRFSKIKYIHLKTTKPVDSLITAPYFQFHKKIYNKMINSTRTVVFKGNVYDAVKNFPQNINVAATLAIISGSPEKIKVSIVADKNLRRNVHEITVLSSAGRIYIRTENEPSPGNPKTSYLASLSVLPLLQQLLKN